MGKPVLDVGLRTLDDRTSRVRAVFDSGNHSTLVRQDVLPKGAKFLRRSVPQELRTAGRGGKLSIVGATVLVVTIGDRMVQAAALVSPDLVQQMLIGAGTMQEWDITIRNKNGQTPVVVGKDLRDPDVQEVD